MTREEKSWILNDWANSAYSVAITTAILPVYFKKVASQGLHDSLSTALWAYANTFATLVVALMAPLLGTLADYRGRKMPLFAGFTVLGVAATAFLALAGPGAWKLCLTLYVISAIGYAGSGIFYDAFLPDVTSKGKMDWISSLGFGWGYFGSTLPFIASLVIIMNPEWIGRDGAGATRASFVLIACWWLLFSLPMMLRVKQRYGLDPEPRPIRASWRRLIATVKNIRQYRAAFLFLLAYFFYIDGVSTIIKMAGVFGSDVGIDTNRLLLIFLVIQLVAFPFAILFGHLAKTFGTRKLLLAGIAVYMGVCAYAPFIRSEGGFWVLAMLVASAQGGVQALSRSAFATLIPANRAAEFFGFYNIFGRFAAVLGPLIYGVLVHTTGSSRFAAVGLLPLFAIGAALLFFVPMGARPVKEGELNRLAE